MNAIIFGQMCPSTVQTTNHPNKRKEPSSLDKIQKQVKLIHHDPVKENRDSNLPDRIDMKSVEAVAPREASRRRLTISQRLTAFFRARDQVQKLESKAQKSSRETALLEKSRRQLEHTTQNLRSIFKISLSFRLADETRCIETHTSHVLKTRAAICWNALKTHYANPHQHVLHAGFLVEQFYKCVPEIKDDVSSRGALEFIAYLIASKAGEDCVDVEIRDLWNLLSDDDKERLSRPQMALMEQFFLLTVGFENLLFDIQTPHLQPPIVNWKQAIKTGMIPTALSFERYLLDKAYENFKKVEGLCNREVNPVHPLLMEYQKAWKNYFLKVDELKHAIKNGQTFANREGEVTIRIVEEEIGTAGHNVPLFPSCLSLDANFLLPLEPLEADG